MTPPPPSGPRLPNRREWTGPASSTAPTPACLDEETLGALAEGRLDESVRSAILPHLAECARCRSTVASLSRALADPDLAREIKMVTPRSKSWRGVAVTGALAASILLVLLVPVEEFRNQRPGSHRSTGASGDQGPATLAPTGDVADVTQLRWSPVQAADRYRVTLFNQGGQVLFETTPTDTFVALPDSVPMSPGIRYLWKVEARIGFDRWVSSELVSFKLVGGARP